MSLPIERNELSLFAEQIKKLRNVMNDTRLRATIINYNSEYVASLLTNSTTLQNASMNQPVSLDTFNSHQDLVLINNVPPEPYHDDVGPPAYAPSNAYNRFTFGKLLNWVGHVLSDSTNPFPLTGKDQDLIGFNDRDHENPITLHSDEIMTMHNIIETGRTKHHDGDDHELIIVFNRESVNETRPTSEIIAVYGMNEIAPDSLMTL